MAKPGIANIFPDLKKVDITVFQIVEAITARHSHNYFEGMSADELERLKQDHQLAEHIMPKHPLSKEEIKENILKNERCINKKLHWLFTRPGEIGASFREKLQSKEICNLTEAKKIATEMWRNYSDNCDKYRVTRVASDDGHGFKTKKARVDGESESSYRSGLAEKQKLLNANKADTDKVLQALAEIKHLHSRLLIEVADPIKFVMEAEDKIKKSVPGYKTPNTIEQARGDMILALYAEYQYASSR